MPDIPKPIGPSVWLRPAEARDFEIIQTIREDTASQDMLLSYPRHQCSDARSWFDAKIANRDAPFLSACLAESKNDQTAPVVGYVQFAQLHRAGRHASFGLAIAPSRRMQGLGRAATRAALLYARDTLSLRKLLLEVRADNKAAIKIYAEEGFRKVGTLRAHYDDGAHMYDVAFMEVLLNEVGP